MAVNYETLIKELVKPLVVHPEDLMVQKFSEEDTFRLSNLEAHEKAKIIGISKECRGEMRRRLLDLGFVNNTLINVDLTSPMQNPRAYLVRDTSIAIRNEQAKFILIEKLILFLQK